MAGTNAGKGKISIIIPVYQAERYLRECLLSVQQQTYENIEVILIDDGSADRSGAICDAFADADERFRVIHQTNQGVSASRNAGLEICRGEYVLFLDADDWLEKDCCRRAAEAMHRIKADLIFFELIIEETGAQKKTSALSSCQTEDPLIKRKLLRSTIPFRNADSREDMVFYGPYCKLFRRDIIDDIRFIPALRYGEDAIFNLQAILHAQSFGFLCDGLYHNRKNPDSATASFREDRVEQSILRLKCTEEIIRTNGLDFLYDVYGEMFVNLCLWVFHAQFSGRRMRFAEGWNLFRKVSDDKELCRIWNTIRQNRKENIRMLDCTFSGKKWAAFAAFCRLRYKRGN